MRIAVASQNPGKVEAVRAAALEVYGADFEIVTRKTPSGISDQPMTLEDTNLGAENRVRNLLELEPTADIAVGQEGGLMQLNDKWIDIGVVRVLGRNGIGGVGLSQGHAVPWRLMEPILFRGKELSEVVAEHYGTDTLADRDCSGVITAGVLPSAEFYRQPTLLALIDYRDSLQAAELIRKNQTSAAD